jgi:DNA-directed RNA polymerase specialized sigma24 family protein
MHEGDPPPFTNGRGAADTLDPASDFERYRGPATKRFIAMARAMGQHTFHDLDDRAQEFYADFWVEWLKRPDRTVPGAPVAYIATAMMNKLRQVNGRGRSVRPPELLRAEGDEILATLATEDLEPAEQAVLHEEMWQVNEILHSLPPREQVAFAAVFGRDSKKKGSPLGGYKLAAQALGVTEVRAKKLSLAANKRIRAAAERVESGHWCDRWSQSIEQVAGGGEGDEAFREHAEHCVHCRLGVVHLRRQAAILPLPSVALLARVLGHIRGTWDNTRDQLAMLLGRHGTTAADAGGIVTTGGSAAGAGITVLKIGAVCMSVGLAGAGAASVCLRAAGLPSPIIEALEGSSPHHRHRTEEPRIHAAASTPLTPKITPISITAPATTPHAPATQTHQTPKRTASTPAHTTAAKRAVGEAQSEFAPGGGFGKQSEPSGTSTSSATSSAQSADASTSAGSTQPAPVHHSPSTSGGSGSSGGTVTTGHSNGLTAP